MKPSEIRELSLEEKLRKANDLKEELFNLRFQHEIEADQARNCQGENHNKRSLTWIKQKKKIFATKTQRIYLLFFLSVLASWWQCEMT